MKNKFLITAACLAVFACAAPIATALAVTKKSPSPAASPSVSPSPKAKSSPSPKTSPSPSAKPSPHPTVGRALPFHGMISAVDQKAKTFTIAGKEKSRVFKITDKTVLSKAGAAATMKDVVANEEVRGSYWKLADGTLEAKTIKLGPMTEAEKAAHETKTSPKTEMSPSSSASALPSSSPSAPPTTAPSASPSASAKP
jgi:hypothetical protein